MKQERKKKPARVFECASFGSDDPIELQHKVITYLCEHPNIRYLDIIASVGEFDYQDTFAQNIDLTISGFCKMIDDLMQGRRGSQGQEH